MTNYSASSQYFVPSGEPGHVSVVSIDQGSLDWQQLQQRPLSLALGDEPLASARPVDPALSLDPGAATDPVLSTPLDPAFVESVEQQDAAARAAIARRSLGAEAAAGQSLPATATTSTTTTVATTTAPAPAAEVPAAPPAPVPAAPAPDPGAAAAAAPTPARGVSADPAARTTPSVSGEPARTSVQQVVVNDGSMSDAALSLAERSAIPADVEAVEGMRPIVFPVLGPVTYADGWGDCRDGCERRHVGTDIIGVQMQPLLAAVDGTVTRISPDPTGISGVVVTITDAEGWRYNYFHVNNDTPGTDDGLALDSWEIAPGLEVGSKVVAGQVIGYMGNSGNAEASVTHLHFEIRDPSGLAHPSYAALRTAEARQACTIGIGPWSTPALADGAELRGKATSPAALRLGSTNEGATIDLATGLPVDPVASSAITHTVVTPLFGNGQWLIDTDGRVTATGDAALIIPGRELDCAAGPLEPFGTDAAGWQTTPDTSALDGTTLTDTDLPGTPLHGLLPDAPILPPLIDPLTSAAPAVPEPTPPAGTGPAPAAGQVAPTVDMPASTPIGVAGAATPAVRSGPPSQVHAFRMPSTGEVILLVFPERADTSQAAQPDASPAGLEMSSGIGPGAMP
jgi:murein DD-endopeptidase MepM/ murein hydrolase activator NlpD